MDFTYFTRALSPYANFKGRDTRQQFWMFILFYFIISIVLTVMDSLIDADIFSLIFGLAVLIPNIAITARRLHDIGKSGWWQLILLIPIIGIIVLIFWLVTEGDSGTNMFGNAPTE